MSGFERTKRTVSGHSVLITSWFDESRKQWQASAPAYSYLDSVAALAREGCASRDAAVKRLSTLLASHFEQASRRD